MQNSQRPSCIKQLQHSPSMERRRRQSAWARARSLNDEIDKPLSKRRMSEVCVIILISFTHLLTNYRGFKHPISSIYLAMLCRTGSFLRPISLILGSVQFMISICAEILDWRLLGNTIKRRSALHIRFAIIHFFAP
jgi:hypothetical protein